MVEMVHVRGGAVVRTGDRVHLRSSGTVVAVDETDILVEFDHGEFVWISRDICPYILRAGNPPRPKKRRKRKRKPSSVE